MGAARRRWPVLALVLLVLLHGGLLASWIQADQHPSRSICCDLVGPVLERVEAVARGEDGSGPLAWAPHRGWLPELGRWGLVAADGAADGLLLVNLVALVLLQVGAFGLARRLGGDLAGVVAAGVVPALPAVALALRRWDVYGVQAALVVLALWALSASRSLTRPLPTLALAGLAVAGLFLSPRETDGILVVGALAAAAGCAALAGLVSGRDDRGARLPRWAVPLGLAVVGGAVAWAAVRGFRFTSPEGLAYYLRERGHGTGAVAAAGAAHRLAYAGRLFWRDIGPWLAIPAEVGLVAWALRGRGRAGVLGALLLPTGALSLLAKKNHYYLAVVHPVVALVLGLGVAALPGPRWGRRGAAAAVLALGLVPLVARTRPEGLLGRALAGTTWQGGDRTWGGVFQTGDGDMDLAPDPAPRPAAALGAAVAAAVPVDACRCRLTVRAQGPGDWEAVALAQARAQPCLGLKSTGRADHAAVVLLAPGAHLDDEAGLGEVARVAAPTGEVRVLARSAAWMRARCPR